MRDDLLSLDLAASDELAAAPASAREALVLLFNGRREVLLSRLAVPGLPQGGTWSATVVAPVGAGAGYESAAGRALAREMGLRTPLRFVGTTWVDAPGGRRFVGVLVGAVEHLADTKGRSFVPVERVMAAARRGVGDLDPAFARACRLIEGEP